MSNYTDKNIQTLAPLEGIRKKLGMYIGGSDNAAVHHVVKEIISNSIDEYLAGFGNTIKIELLKDNSICISDYGRGIPLGKVEDVFTKLHTSGKFEKEGDAAYGASGGLNGAGLKIATATGQVSVTISREGKLYSNQFSYTNGTKTPSITTSSPGFTGTSITWKPDEGVFSENTLYIDKIKALVEDLSYITPNLTFELIYDGVIEKISSKSIGEFIENSNDKNSFLSPIMNFKVGNDTLYAEGALAWTKNSTKEKSYVNLIPTVDGGTHCTILKTVLTRELNKFLGSDLKGDEIRKGLTFILSIKMLEEPIFRSQEKSALNMPNINASLSQLLTPSIQLLLSQYKDFFQQLEKMIAQARKQEESVNQIREVLAKARASANPIPNKLKPALATRGAELFITEGLSASGSLISHRDVYKHAIMSLKGKPINVLKHELEKVLKNDEIKDLIIAMGGFGDNYTASKCIYDKIIIVTDADQDGAHINLLLLTFFYTYYPQLIREGKIYTIETPLYSIKRNNRTEYVFTQAEMDKIKPNLPKTAVYSRFKGLGEVNPEVLAQFTFSNSRVLKQYKMEDEEMVQQLLENFMGEDGAERREFVN
jgi:DNA gyrase subunit B